MAQAIQVRLSKLSDNSAVLQKHGVYHSSPLVHYVLNRKWSRHAQSL